MAVWYCTIFCIFYCYIDINKLYNLLDVFVDIISTINFNKYALKLNIKEISPHLQSNVIQSGHVAG